MCATHLADDPTGLTCVRLTPHDPHHGCVYESASGSAADDRHVDRGHG